MLAYELQRIYQAEINAKISYKQNHKNRYKTKPTKRQKQVLEAVKYLGAGTAKQIQTMLGEQNNPHVVLNSLIDKGYIQFEEDNHIYYTSESALSKYLGDPNNVSPIFKCRQYAQEVGVFHRSELKQFTDSASSIIHRMMKKGELENVGAGRWKWIDETH